MYLRLCSLASVVVFLSHLSHVPLPNEHLAAGMQTPISMTSSIFFVFQEEGRKKAAKKSHDLRI